MLTDDEINILWITHASGADDQVLRFARALLAKARPAAGEPEICDFCHRAEHDGHTEDCTAAGEPEALTDKQIDAAIVAWFDDYGFQDDFRRRMRNAIAKAKD